jgi:hypothetical protein
MIHVFEGIIKSGLMAVSVRADDMLLADMMTRAADPDAGPRTVFVCAFQAGGLPLACLRMDAAKISLVPLWSDRRKPVEYQTLYYVANIRGTAGRGSIADMRPDHVVYRGH